MLRTHRSSRPRRALLGLAGLSALVACGGDLLLAPPADDAARTVELFAHLADSVARSGGDSLLGGAWAAIAETVRQGGRIAPVAITIDGVPATFMVTALQSEVSVTPCGATPGCGPATLTILRTLVAWQRDDPRRVVQLSSGADADPIRAYLVPVLVPFPGNSASLVFLNGRGGAFFGTSGTQRFSVAATTTPCAVAGATKPIVAIFPAPPRCTQADFSVAFTATAEPSTFLAGRNSATGSHTFSMPAQPVPGARYELTAALPPLPPITVTHRVSLPASLAARMDSLVTLTLTVSNPSGTPATIEFNSGQHYDFTIADPATGALLWRWSLGMAFTQALGSQVVPPGGTLVYSAQWKPTRTGNLAATGTLVSQSHRAEATITITVP